jgi:xylan 1,4-beta-xylosidase
LTLEDVRDNSVRGRADVSALATRDARSAAVLVWNYHDDDLPAPAADIELTIAGLPPGRPMLSHYRIDGDHGNAYTLWKKMGLPQPPTPAQHRALEQAGQLQLLDSRRRVSLRNGRVVVGLDPPRRVDVRNGRVAVSFTLPRQGVSLVKLVW